MNQKVNEVEVIPANTAAQLDQHEKNIRTFFAGETKGAAEFFAYAFLVGREMLAAKEKIPHGNADPNQGIKNWLAARFKKLSYRTCASRMQFAAGILDRAGDLPPLKKRPLLLSKGEITDKDRATILQLIPLVMDGKGMVAFMRDCKLLRDAEKQKHHPVKPVSPQEANKAKIKQAKRGWANVRSEMETWKKTAKLLSAEDLTLTIDACVDTANVLRETLKRIKPEAKND